MNPPPPLVVGPLTRTDVVRYQGASGDFNPIHHDEPFALSTGLPAPIAVGMLPAAILATWATDWLGAENIRRYRVRFARPVFPGDTLTCSGRVVSVTADTTDLELECTRQDGTVAIRAWATFASANGTEATR
jgi:acyl dehydratase